MSDSVLTVAQAARTAKVSARTIYALIASEQLEAVKFGRRIVVTKVALSRYLKLTPDELVVDL